MLLLIILIVLALAGCIGGHFYEKAHEYDMSPLGFLISCTGVSAALAVIVIGIAFSCSDKDDEKFIADYESTVELVQQYPIGQGQGEFAPVLEKAVKINEKITDNKVHSQSKWIGVFYSKKIAKLDYIKLPDFVKPGEE